MKKSKLSNVQYLLEIAALASSKNVPEIDKHIERVREIAMEYQSMYELLKNYIRYDDDMEFSDPARQLIKKLDKK